MNTGTTTDRCTHENPALSPQPLLRRTSHLSPVSL